MKKIITVVGARPQFVKVAAVSRVLRKHVHEILVHTGQHYDANMSDVFFEELHIPRPNYHLNVGSANHGVQTAQAMIGIEEIILSEKPDAVMVYGDTNSTLAGALVAAKLHIPVFHVEAGLRSYNKKMPEEINRILTDHVSQLLFTPSDVAVNNLQREGIEKGVYQVGDVMYDALLYYLALTDNQDQLNALNLTPQNYALCTIHRAENTDHPTRLQQIVHGLNALPFPVVFPIHPRTLKYLKAYQLDGTLQEHIKLIQPCSYLEMIGYQKDARCVITDSGGIQKEAYFLKVPCFTLRDETEWVETLQNNWNTLINLEQDALNHSILTHEKKEYIPHLYGDGNASEKITQILKEYWG